jgi:hypothetical protein
MRSDGVGDESCLVAGEGDTDEPTVGHEVAEPGGEAVTAADEGAPGRGCTEVATVRVVCRRCAFCGERGVLEDVDALGYVEWSELGKNIQEALPELDADQRELLISGTHAHCWEMAFGGDDD